MPLLHLESLPFGLSKGELLRLVCEAGRLDGKRVGKIELVGGQATVEILEESITKLVAALDGSTVRNRKIRARSAPSASESTPRSTTEGEAGGADHFRRLGRLLQIEAEAEAREAMERMGRLSPAEAERSGVALVGLTIREEYSGLGGRLILTFAKKGARPLPWTRLSVGSPVLLSADSSGAKPVRGVVCERDERLLRVALSGPLEEDSQEATWRIDLANDEVARQRQLAAMERARAAQKDRLAELRDILLGEAEPRFEPQADCVPLDESLNESQQAAVRFALSARDLAILHGPPGTGKTTTVVEVIRQMVQRGDRVLACAPSNVAVDNILERLVAFGVRAVRVGHPARVSPELRRHTLDLMVEDHDDVRLARKYAKEAFALFRQASRFSRARPEPGERRDLRQEAKSLLADARKLEAGAVDAVLDAADVVCSTMTGIDSEVLGQRQFDWVVIDEACQSTEPGCWIPVPRSGGVILAGDHCQLPPTVIAPEAIEGGLAVSMLERLATKWGDAVTRLLTVQYRMSEEIMDFSSLEFYDAQLEAAELVRRHRLGELPGVKVSDADSDPALVNLPVHFIDTAGAGYDEALEPDGESRLNPQEAALVIGKVRALVAAGVRPEAIAVIAPYSAQTRLLRESLRDVERLEIDSVDGFQGREKEVVVISLVRSNPRGEIGFLAEVRRMNVALTRARRKLLVVGDSATLSGNPFYHRLFDYFESVGGYRTVWEEA